MGKYGAKTSASGGTAFVSRDLLTPDEVRTLPPGDMIAFVRGYRPAWLGKLDVRNHPAFQGCFEPNPTYFVLPSAPKAIAPPAAGGPMLNAADAIARAKSQPKISARAIAAALEDKYRGKSIRLEGDMIGYDEAWLNPETGQTEMVFMPIMHATMLDALEASG